MTRLRGDKAKTSAALGVHDTEGAAIQQSLPFAGAGVETLELDKGMVDAPSLIVDRGVHHGWREFQWEDDDPIDGGGVDWLSVEIVDLPALVDCCLVVLIHPPYPSINNNNRNGCVEEQLKVGGGVAALSSWTTTFYCNSVILDGCCFCCIASLIKNIVLSTPAANADADKAFIVRVCCC